MASDFLISFASADRRWAEWIAAELRRAGCSSALQPSDQPSGESFAVAVGLALFEAAVMIAVISPVYLRSGATKSDFEAALVRARQRLIPVVVAPADLPYPLAGLVSVDLTRSDEQGARGLLLKAALARVTSDRDASSRGAIGLPGPDATLFPAGPGRAAARRELGACSGSPPRKQVFVCYSHVDADAKWLDRLVIHLKPLQRAGLIDLWSDRRLKYGDRWREEIAAALTRASVALLLVSADFLASDFIQDVELPKLLESAAQAGCRIIPVLVRPSLFEKTPSLSCFQPSNRGPTLSEMTPEQAERVLSEIARSLISLSPGTT